MVAISEAFKSIGRAFGIERVDVSWRPIWETPHPVPCYNKEMADGLKVIEERLLRQAKEATERALECFNAGENARADLHEAQYLSDQAANIRHAVDDGLFWSWRLFVEAEPVGDAHLPREDRGGFKRQNLAPVLDAAIKHEDYRVRWHTIKWDF